LVVANWNAASGEEDLSVAFQQIIE